MYNRWKCILALLALISTQVAAEIPTLEAALSRDPAYDPDNPAMVVELTIPSHGKRMPAHLYVASGAGPHPTVVFLHGFPGNERNLDVAQALRRFGFNTLYFHYRGAWGAEGEYRLTQLPEDAIAVLNYLREPGNASQLRVDTRALSVLGHSLGGYTALAAGAADADLSCVIALSPVNLGLWRGDMQTGGNPLASRLKAYADSLFMLQGLSGARLAEELSYADPAILDTRRFAPGLQNKAVLMIVGEQDDVTPAQTMFDPVVAAYRESEDIRLTAVTMSGDHSFSWSRVALTREILSWSSQHCR